MLRAFAVARGDSYTAMPGGLTRVAGPATRGPVISGRAGAISKDTWVLGLRARAAVRLLVAPRPAGGGRSTRPGRCRRAPAENLFWLGRYAERAEAMARLLRCVHDRRNDFSAGANPAGTECLRVLLGALTHVTTTYPGFVGDGGDERLAAPGAELFALPWTSSRPGTLAHAVRHLLDAAHAVRDQLSTDTWMVVGTLEREVAALG